MSEAVLADRPTTVTALETIGILRIAGAVVLGGIQVGFGLLFDLLWLGFLLWLVLKVTRRGSANARIALTILFVLGIVVTIAVITYLGPAWREALDMEIDGPVLAISIVMWVLAVAQLALLWSPSTTRWIERHQLINPPA
jgi:hypothetical protein